MRVMMFFIILSFHSCKSDDISVKRQLINTKDSNSQIKSSDSVSCEDIPSVDSLIYSVLSLKKIHGYSKDANLRNYDIVLSNELIPPGRKFDYEYAFSKISYDELDLKDLNLGWGIIDFKTIKFNEDSTNCYLEIDYFGDDGFVNMESYLNYYVDMKTCK